MGPTARHQCLIYDGSPSRNLPIRAEAIRQNLANKYRCLYLDSPPMVAGMQSALWAAGIDVAQEVARGSLQLSSDQSHLDHGRFDVDRMIATLEAAVRKAVGDGCHGLWATGDMTWEFGPELNFDSLLEYEWRLEQLFYREPALCGVCQYHRDVLPREAVREGLVSHRRIYINQTLSRLNPYYVSAEVPVDRRTALRPELDEVIAALIASEPA
jgi:MEDS: MEthanogen/methylotroph, DcmR Sensory domain